MKKILILLAAASVMFAACDPAQQEEQTKAATVSVNAGEVTTSSVTFTVTSENAEAVAYICVEGAAPAGEAILEQGTAVEPNTTVPVTVNDLKDGVAYTVVAAAMNELGVVVSETVTMTTTEIPANPQVTITEVEATDVTYTFSINPSDAEKCAYKVYAEGETPTVEDVLANGEAASSGEASEITISDMPDGSYFVVAAVQNGDKTAMSEALSFTLSNLPVVIVGETYYESYKKYFSPNSYNTAMELGVQFKYKDHMNKQADIILEFCLPIDATCLLEGTYSIPADGNVGPGCLNPAYCEHKTPNDEITSRYYFETMTVTVTHVDGKYRLVGEGLQCDKYEDEHKILSKLVFDITCEIPGLPII